MTTILLVRHAEVAAPKDILLGRNDEVGLSRRGRGCAATLAERLGRLPISAIWSSPLKRALRTARPIAERLSLSVQIAHSLTEIDYGRWTGRRFAELEDDPDWQSYNRTRSAAQIPEGEKIEAVERRVVTLLQTWAEGYPSKLIAAVTHAEIIRIAILHSIGVSTDRYDQIEISLCSLSALAFERMRPRVICLNASAELECFLTGLVL
ncbi:MAG: histidine phosphatase family protein [Deltaproteobacteria bacterium]|nr:histidine phosphatase family protein [Deltaproteobacteria bacterium]